MKTKNDLLKSIDGFIEKARVREHKGLFATRIPPYYVQPKGSQKGYWVPKDKSEKLDWETIQKIREEGRAVDWEVMKDSDVEVFPPASGERPHKHLYANQSHPVSLEHERPKHKAAHDKEISSYKESYSKLFDPNDPNRLHVHEGGEEPHEVSEPHKAELQSAHNDEVDQYEKEYYDIDKEPKIWLDKFNVKTIQEKFPQASDGTAMVYSSNHPAFKTMKPIKTFERRGVSYVLVQDKYYKFDKTREALDFIKSIFELRYDRTKIKKGLDEFFSKQILKDGPSAQPISVCLLSKYKSGNNEVSLSGDKGNYTVEVNGSKELSTDSLQEALAKYYSSIGKVIKAHTDNKDMALEIFGDQVVSDNRKIIPLLSALGEEKSVKMLKSIDYSEIEYFFRDGKSVNLFSDLEKYEPQVGIVQGVPVIEEEGQGAAEGGKKPGRKDLIADDYKISKPMDENQKPILETSKPLISPAVVSKNDLSGFPAKPEENLPAKDPIVPVMVKDNYMSDEKPEEQKPIIGKSFDNNIIIKKLEDGSWGVFSKD